MTFAIRQQAIVDENHRISITVDELPPGQTVEIIVLAEPSRRRSPLPAIRKAAAAGAVPALSNAEIQAILDEEDAEHASRSTGH